MTRRHHAFSRRIADTALTRTAYLYMNNEWREAFLAVEELRIFQ